MLCIVKLLICKLSTDLNIRKRVKDLLDLLLESKDFEAPISQQVDLAVPDFQSFIDLLVYSGILVKRVGAKDFKLLVY